MNVFHSVRVITKSGDAPWVFEEVQLPDWLAKNLGRSPVKRPYPGRDGVIILSGQGNHVIAGESESNYPISSIEDRQRSEIYHEVSQGKAIIPEA